MMHYFNRLLDMNEGAHRKTLELIGGVLGMAQYTTVKKNLGIVGRYPGSPEAILVFCLTNALPGIGWSKTRDTVAFTNFDLSDIARR